MLSVTTGHDLPTYEQMIAQLRSVLGTRVVTDAEGRITEIHVIATPERSAKAIVRDIQTTLLIRAGTRVDHRRVSVVQLNAASLNAASPDGTVPGVQVRNVARHDDGSGAVVTVTLAFGAQTVQGVGRATPEQTMPPEALAVEATLDALRQLLAADRQAVG